MGGGFALCRARFVCKKQSILQLKIPHIGQRCSAGRTLQLHVHPLVQAISVERMMARSDHKGRRVVVVNRAHANRAVRVHVPVLPITSHHPPNRRQRVVVILLRSQEARHHRVRVVLPLDEDHRRLPFTTSLHTHLQHNPHDKRNAVSPRQRIIGDGVQQVVANLSLSPAFIIAKGGITSSGSDRTQADRRRMYLGSNGGRCPSWRERTICGTQKEKRAKRRAYPTADPE